MEVIREVCFLVDTSFRCAQKEPTKPLHSFPPPHSTFIFYIKENFTTASDQGFNRLLISMYAVLLGKNNKLIKGWLAATHMLVLRGTGLGLIDWFFKVVKEASKPPSLVVWGQISKDQITWRWCTLVDDAYLSAFSTAYNKAMTCVCALITVNCNPRSLEDYTQFNNYRNIISAILGADMGGHYFRPPAVMTRKRLMEASGREGGCRRRSRSTSRGRSGDESEEAARDSHLVF
ncbi:hypothetical protein J6590_093810 [Homalodisca vitripennis]|nr:hypothetical protein J6590_093810 [Homalodisca vitripennis]